MTSNQPPAIPALLPRGPGHQFVCYGDSCSGIPGAPHEATFARINAIIRRLHPAPEFLCFPGDAITGLTVNAGSIRAQWRYWLDQEMGWLDRHAVPLYLTPGNHDLYDLVSEAIWREMHHDLPRNGPPGQEGMSYLVRRGDLALIFVNTMPLALGGEGRADVAWVEEALQQVGDARYRLVVGHHPVWPTNGYAGQYQRQINESDGEALWASLVRHRVIAYLTSHMLAFDVQCHAGVLQIMTAGAGTIHRLPPDSEYLHAVQLALDQFGLRLQVLDDLGVRREWLSWPPLLPSVSSWPAFSPTMLCSLSATTPWLLALRLTGRAAANGRGEPQTLLSGWPQGEGTAPLWIGLEGTEQRLMVLVSQQLGRSPHRWIGPAFPAGAPIDYQLLLHSGMGPGGLLGREGDHAPWSGLDTASAWGLEQIAPLTQVSVGHGQLGAGDRPFRGQGLTITAYTTALRYDEEASAPVSPSGVQGS